MLFVIIMFCSLGLGALMFENKYYGVIDRNGKLEYKYSKDEQDAGMRRYCNIFVIIGLVISSIVYFIIGF